MRQPHSAALFVKVSSRSGKSLRAPTGWLLAIGSTLLTVDTGP